MNRISTFLTVLSFVCVPFLGHAQLRVSTDGQVQMDAGQGYPNEATTISVASSETALYQAQRSVLSLVNRNKTIGNLLRMDFSTLSNNNQIEPYAAIMTEFLDRTPSLRSGNFHIGISSRGSFSPRFTIKSFPYNTDDASFHFNTGISGSYFGVPDGLVPGLNLSPSTSSVGAISPFLLYQSGLYVDDSGNGQTTLRPAGTGYGYIGTAEKKWGKLYVNYAQFRDHPTVTSDERSKENIEALPEGEVLPRLSLLRPVRYNL